jgi:ATP-dependent DNA helicase DinG
MPSAPKTANKEKTSRRTGAPRRKADTLEAFFGPTGPLAHTLPGYEAREEQLHVSQAVEQAMREGRPCLAEAGTGVGKTLAYLVPAVRAALDGKVTVISTHTISLQTQLIEKDIPLVLSLFPGAEEKVSATLMKGRGNYLCKQDLENARGDLFLMSDPLFKQVERWQRDPDCSGDVADLPFQFSAWGEISSNLDTCRGQECHHYNSCFYYRMRWEAAESNLIIVNHALFLADLALRRGDPNAGVLPEYDYVVFDEAHHLEDVATKTFGIDFGSRRLINLMERIKHVKGLDIDRSRLQTLEELNSGLFAPFVQTGKSEFLFEEALPDETRAGVETWTGQTCNSISELQNDLLDQAKADENLRERLEGMARLCGRAREELNQLFFQQDANAIRWAEMSYGGRDRKEPRVTLHLTPISISEILETSLWGSDRLRIRQGSVILISATLANSGTFSYVRQRLGVPDDAVECIVGSPFDYKRQAMLYVPGHLPAPDRSGRVPDYTDKVVAEIERVLQLSGGRAFLLFTSRAMLNTVHERLSASLPFPLFKQGDLPPGKLVEAFKASGNGCLLGAQTFWEGVDIQGEALSCVIIDRLPFAVPDSPVTRARTQAIQSAGGDWFRDYSIPQAQIRLKQGFGRLIRTRADHGIVCILDSRLITKDYGAEFVKYLPPASRASKWSRVEKFWHGESLPAQTPSVEDSQ